ncbi:nucleotidyltransferase family protein, partial [candidate division KSB1 bacterium]|nr:nucleotidyltransferase family protein [candidate division KSB1 bacterium]
MILPVEKILTIAPEHAAVLALLRSRLLKDGACRCRPAADLSPAALAWAMEQRVVLLLYDGLKRCGGADSETIDALKALYRANAVRSIRFEGELVALHRLFASAGISFMLLKGLALS